MPSQQQYSFPCRKWLELDSGKGFAERRLPVARYSAHLCAADAIMTPGVRLSFVALTCRAALSLGQ